MHAQMHFCCGQRSFFGFKHFLERHQHGDALDAEGALAAPMGDALHSTWMKEGNILVGQKHC